MAGSTTNLGLIKPLGSEKIRIAQLNQNSDTLDAAIGAVGSTSLQAQVSAIEDGIAIVANGDSHVAITAGQFVYVRNNTHNLAEGLYVASANVSANGSITSSNMTADPSGGLNALNAKISTHEISGSTVSDIQSALVTYGNSLGANEKSNIKFAVSTASGVFESATYFGTIQKVASNRFIVLVNGGTNPSQDIEGVYYNSAWTWNSLNANLIDLQTKMRPSFYDKNGTSVTITGISGGRYIIFVVTGNANRGAMIIGGITSNGVANIGMSNVGSDLTVSTDGASYVITASANTYFNVLVFTTSSNSTMPTFS